MSFLSKFVTPETIVTPLGFHERRTNLAFHILLFIFIAYFCMTVLYSCCNFAFIDFLYSISLIVCNTFAVLVLVTYLETGTTKIDD